MSDLARTVDLQEVLRRVDVGLHKLSSISSLEKGTARALTKEEIKSLASEAQLIDETIDEVKSVVKPLEDRWGDIRKIFFAHADSVAGKGKKWVELVPELNYKLVRRIQVRGAGSFNWGGVEQALIDRFGEKEGRKLYVSITDVGDRVPNENKLEDALRKGKIPDDIVRALTSEGKIVENFVPSEMTDKDWEEEEGPDGVE